MGPIIKLEGVDAFYGATQVLHGVTLAVQKGSVTSVLGANGAGKTTLLRAISGLIRTQGELQLADVSIAGRKTEDIARLGVAHVPDGRGTLTQLTVEENLRLGAHTRRDAAGVRDDFERVFGYFPRLKERRSQQAGMLSGGEQQMLAIGRALMMRPRLLLLDEPSFGLAPIVIQEIFRIMKTINQQDRMSILLVEQNVARALELASHAYVLETGRVVMSGTSQQLRDDESIQRAYLGT